MFPAVDPTVFPALDEVSATSPSSSGVTASGLNVLPSSLYVVEPFESTVLELLDESAPFPDAGLVLPVFPSADVEPVLLPESVAEVVPDPAEP